MNIFHSLLSEASECTEDNYEDACGANNNQQQERQISHSLRSEANN